MNGSRRQKSNSRVGEVREVLGRVVNQCLMAGGLVMAPFVLADDWPQWLGEHRDGVWRESGIVEAFPEAGLAVVWRFSRPAGCQGSKSQTLRSSDGSKWEFKLYSGRDSGLRASSLFG